jgi:hypothetical protein
MRPDESHSIRISETETLEWSAPREAQRQASVQDLEQLAHWLDSLFEIPGLRLRVGIDALLGLVPGVGDTVSALASVYLLRAAATFGVPRVTVVRMTLNIVVDLVLGAIPIIGDVFDVYWKANRRNVELLRRHLNANPAKERELRRSDGLFVAGMIALIATILIASVMSAYFILAWLVRAVAV